MFLNNYLILIIFFAAYSSVISVLISFVFKAHAIADFEKFGKQDEHFVMLDKLVKENNGLWSAETEKYLLNNF